MAENPRRLFFAELKHYSEDRLKEMKRKIDAELTKRQNGIKPPPPY